MRILILYANPKGTDKVKLDQEIRMIQESLEWAKVPDLKFDNIGFVKKNDLLTKLIHYKPEIVQISSHMTDEGGLVLEDEKRQISIVPPKSLENVFANTPNVGCVLLNCCYAESQAKAISRYIPFVIGMRGTIRDSVARLFSAKLFQSIGIGLNLQHAFNIAKAEIGLLDETFSDLPRLICKKGADPSRRYFLKLPQIMAKFKVNRRGVPVLSENDLYQFDVFIDNAPNDVKSVLYQYLEDEWELENQVSEKHNSKNRFMDTLEEDGEIEIRATLWKQDGGVAINCNLSQALRNYYGLDAPNPIEEAITDIIEYNCSE